MLLFIFLYFLPDATNYITEPSILPHTEFYNETLDSIELFREYTNWQNPNYQGGFSFCQYPFLLTISAKKQILQKDSEQQMISQARVCLPLPLPLPQCKLPYYVCCYKDSIFYMYLTSTRNTLSECEYITMNTRKYNFLAFCYLHLCKRFPLLQKTIVKQVQSRQAPELEALFLNLSVRRRTIVADSLTEVV